VAIRNIRRDIQPEIMLIEPTGLAIPTKIVEGIDMIPQLFPDFGDYEVDIIGVVDPVRFRIFVSKKGKFMAEQIEGSSIVMMNKIDIAPAEEVQFTEDWIRERMPDIVIKKVSALSGDGVEEALKEVCI
jgi:G3E family GTPase